MVFVQHQRVQVGQLGKTRVGVVDDVVVKNEFLEMGKALDGSQRTKTILTQVKDLWERG